jgi:hypothetical protein
VASVLSSFYTVPTLKKQSGLMPIRDINKVMWGYWRKLLP